MPKTRDPNYDTREEYKMDFYRDVGKRRCQCGTVAVIKTVYDRDGEAYHCSELCRQWWLKQRRVSTIGAVEHNAEGWYR